MRLIQQDMKNEKIAGIKEDEYGCANFKELFEIKDRLEPTIGEGYQLWETTSEGSPASLVFGTVEELAERCQGNATVFVDAKASKEEWLKMFSGDFIVFKLSENVVVI